MSNLLLPRFKVKVSWYNHHLDWSSESDDDRINETDYVLWRAHAATRPSRSLRHSEPVSGAAQLPLPDEDEPFRSESSSESDDEPFNEADYVRVNESDCEDTSDSEAAATTSKRWAACADSLGTRLSTVIVCDIV